MASALSDKERLSLYTDACAQGLLVVETDVSTKGSKAVATVDTGSEGTAKAEAVEAVAAEQSAATTASSG